MIQKPLSGSVLVFLLIFPACESDPPGPSPAEPGEPSEIPAEAVAWLREEAIPFRSDVPDEDFSDLEFLRAMVGDARVVALGEASHGTREFFRMKDRVLRFLVQEMDFNAFAIEATWPELNRIDDFVHTGNGDPAVLLSGQYFWTWRTQEVMDMILWVRDYNRAAADPVSFLGFDMQYPGMGIHNVLEYVRDLDPDVLAFAEERIACMQDFANGPDGRFPADYAEETPEFRNDCRTSLDEIFDLLSERRTAFVEATSERDFELALQSLRTVLQFEDMKSERIVSARDFHMAENTLWILDQLGPDAKLVVWAHNFHVSDDEGAQGSFLRESLGEDYVNLGFSFWTGRVTAFGLGGLGLGTYAVASPPPESYEAHFQAAELPRFILDLRDIAFDSPATEWLLGPRQFREIGCCLDLSDQSVHVRPRQLPARFDGVIFFETTEPSALLPSNTPAEF